MRIENFEDFVQQLEAAAKIRNVICHGSWGAPDENGASVPFYVTGKPGEQEVFETPVTVAWPDQLQAHASELACEVVNIVTHMGYQFPGGTGLGRPVGSSFEMTSQDSEGAAPDAEHPAHQPESVLHGVAENMREMFAHHSQHAVPVVDLALDLLRDCGWESWAADGGTQQGQEFEQWRGDRGHLEAYGDPECSKRFPVFIKALALSQCLPNVTIGLARSALICMHGFFAQARASFRATVEECLYAYMLIQDPERCRQYLGDSKTLWQASGKLRKKWDNDSRSTDAAVHASVPNFGLTYVRIHQDHIHSGSHAGFAQSSHRTTGMSQAFVDINTPHLGSYSVAFAAAVLQLVNDLVPLHAGVDVAAWRAGYAAFDKAKWSVLNTLRQD